MKNKLYFERKEHTDFKVGLLLAIFSLVLGINSFIVGNFLYDSLHTYYYLVALGWMCICFLGLIAGLFLMFDTEYVKYDIKEVKKK